MEDSAAPPGRAESPRLDALLFVGIAALAFVLRLVHLHQARAVPLFDALLMDGLSYSRWADTIVAGDWLGDRVFYQAPLYPYFLAVVKLAVGDDLWAIRIVQIAIGSIACGILFLAGKSFFSRPAGIAAGVLLAIYPPAIFFDGLVQKANLGLLWTVLLLWTLARLRTKPGARNDTQRPLRLGVAGAVLGLLMLTREETILLVPVIAAWVWFSRPSRMSAASRTAARAEKERDRRREAPESAPPLAERWKPLASFVAGLALILLPVGLRNLAVGDEFALTTSQAGPNFYIGNHAGAPGIYTPLRPGRQNTSFERQDAVDLAELALGKKLTAGEVSRYWRDQAFAFIRAQPFAWAGLLLRKADLVLNAYEVPDYEDLYFYERDCALLAVLGKFWHFGILAPLAAAGIVLTWKRRSELAILYALLATIAAGVVLFYVFARYRYPLVPILCLFAGAAFVAPFGALRRPRTSEWTLAAVVALAIGFMSNRTLFEKDHQLAASLSNAGSVFANRGEDARAVELLQKSLAVKPDSPETRGNLGLSLMRLGRAEEAIAAFAQAAALLPGSAAAQLRLAAALEQVGRVDEAVAPLSRALALDKKGVLEDGNTMVHNKKGRDLVALDILAAAQAANGKFAEAAATASMALELTPRPEQAALQARIRERLELYRQGKTDR